MYLIPICVACFASISFLFLQSSISLQLDDFQQLIVTVLQKVNQIEL